MPVQINQTGQHTYGAGEVWFALFKPGTQIPDAYRYLGNSPGFTLTQSGDDLDHEDSDHGIKFVDDSVQTSSDLAGKLETDNISKENIALYFTGSINNISQTSSTGLIFQNSSIKFGMYQLGATDQKPTGDKDVSSVVVKDSSGGSITYVAGVDYIVDVKRGQIEFIQGGTITEGLPVYVTYARAASTRVQVIGSNNVIEGAMIYKSFNPKGPTDDYTMPKVKLKPDGDYALKGDSWLTMGYGLKVSKRGSLPRVLIDGVSVTS